MKKGETFLELSDLRGLSRKELAHMLTEGLHSLESVQRQREFMEEHDRPGLTACFDCKAICKRIAENRGEQQ